MTRRLQHAQRDIRAQLDGVAVADALKLVLGLGARPQVDARTGAKHCVTRFRPHTSLAFENIYCFFVGVMMQRRAAWRDDADELRDAARARFLIDQ